MNTTKGLLFELRRFVGEEQYIFRAFVLGDQTEAEKRELKNDVDKVVSSKYFETVVGLYGKEEIIGYLNRNTKLNWTAEPFESPPVE